MNHEPGGPCKSTLYCNSVNVCVRDENQTVLEKREPVLCSDSWCTKYSQSGMKNQLHRDFTVTPRPLRAQEEIQIAGHMYPSGFGSTFLKTFSSVHDVVLIKSIFVQMRVIPTVTGDQNHHRLIEQAPRNLSLCTVCLIRLHN